MDHDDASPAAPTVLPASPPPSINQRAIIHGESYTYQSPVPSAITADPNAPVVLGVDEAGRGPVLGPMVYGVFYLPETLHQSLLSETHHFDDSKVLTPGVRARLVAQLTDPASDLFRSCGWATRVLSARDIAAGMLRPAPYNLNAQALDATVALIAGVYRAGVPVSHIYVDTVGQPAAYQAKLERVFPMARITVAKKADSLYPCVSAASVCAKVTRDVALEEAWAAECAAERAQRAQRAEGAEAAERVERVERVGPAGGEEGAEQAAEQNDPADGQTEPAGDMAWGSGYPSDARCAGWLQRTTDPLFGWSAACRFSWSTARDLLETRGVAFQVDWPADDDEASYALTDFFRAQEAGMAPGRAAEGGELVGWYGRPVAEGAF